MNKAEKKMLKIVIQRQRFELIKAKKKRINSVIKTFLDE